MSRENRVGKVVGIDKILIYHDWLSNEYFCTIHVNATVMRQYPAWDAHFANRMQTSLLHIIMLSIFIPRKAQLYLWWLQSDYL